jgi:hypothetical protein
MYHVFEVCPIREDRHFRTQPVLFVSWEDTYAECMVAVAHQSEYFDTVVEADITSSGFTASWPFM